MDLHRFEIILMDLEFPKGLGGSSWFVFGVQVGPEESPRGSEGSQAGSVWGFGNMFFLFCSKGELVHGPMKY